MIVSRFFLVREMSQTEVVETIKTGILCSVTFLRKSCRSLSNVEKHGRAEQTPDDNIIRLIYFACYEQKLRISNMYFLLFQATMVTQTRLIVRLYTHCLLPVLSINCNKWWSDCTALPNIWHSKVGQLSFSGQLHKSKAYLLKHVACGTENPCLTNDVSSHTTPGRFCRIITEDRHKHTSHT